MTLLKKLDENILKWLLIFFVFFIPLYPKFPFKIVNYTYVAIRLDDFFIALITGVFILQLLRNKIKLKDLHFLKPVLIFWGVIFLSLISGLYITHTIDFPLVGFFNAFRRIEYMIVFFIAMSAIRTAKDFKFLMYALVVSLCFVDIYGIGQRFFGFPAIQTMNPEYALGKILYLTPEARISSTFAGHYDLAAYLVFLLPLLWGMFFYARQVILLLLAVLSMLILTLTASRTSSIAYLISNSIFLLYFRKIRYFILIILLTIGFTYIDTDLLNRWLKTIQIKQILLNEQTGERIVVQNITSDELPAGTAFVKIKKDEDTTASSLLKEELRIKASLSGTLEATEEAQYQTVSAVATDISIATRFQASWPRAIQAFQKNPLLGSGPSSITESSDGDYFRWLGETGILGFSFFIYIIIMILKRLYDFKNKLASSAQMLVYGVIFGTIGLFINALLIDVFEASKVAYIFWFTLGIFVGLIYLNKNELKRV